ncbi:hypothetical protein [Exiguobacterium profundum]|uniref:hypothetical protein n=1 Tax=Exiguobacterium profundum TaxID=307643 RepID=UPI0028A96A35|nr:hypothetical protein [Exiguobacterium profundum]
MASSSQADKPKEAKATTPKEDDLQKIMNLGTFQTYIRDPQMKKREFQVGQPVFPSPDRTERWGALPLSLFHSNDGQGGYMEYRPNGFRCTHQTGQNIVQSIWSTTTKKEFKNGFRYFTGEKSEIDLVFLVPEKEKTLVLYASSSAMPKVYTVKIDVP